MPPTGLLLPPQSPEQSAVVPPPSETLIIPSENPLLQTPEEQERLLISQFCSLSDLMTNAQLYATTYRQGQQTLYRWRQQDKVTTAESMALGGLLDYNVLSYVTGWQDLAHECFEVTKELLGVKGIPVIYRQKPSSETDGNIESFKPGLLISMGHVDLETCSFVATILTSLDKPRSRAFIYLRHQLVSMGPAPDQQIIRF